MALPPMDAAGHVIGVLKRTGRWRASKDEQKHYLPMRRSSDVGENLVGEAGNLAVAAVRHLRWVAFEEETLAVRAALRAAPEREAQLLRDNECMQQQLAAAETAAGAAAAAAAVAAAAAAEVAAEAAAVARAGSLPSKTTAIAAWHEHVASLDDDDLYELCEAVLRKDFRSIKAPFSCQILDLSKTQEVRSQKKPFTKEQDGGCQLAVLKGAGEGYKSEVVGVLRCGSHHKYSDIDQYLSNLGRKENRLAAIGGAAARDAIQKLQEELPHYGAGLCIQNVRVLYVFSFHFGLDDARHMAASALHDRKIKAPAPCNKFCTGRPSSTKTTGKALACTLHYNYHTTHHS